MSKEEALSKLLSTVGTKVKIRRDSRYAHQNSGVGEVVKESFTRGWMNVKFEDGTDKFNYRYGLSTVDNGKFDLELADPQEMMGSAISEDDIDKVKLLLEAEVVDLDKRENYDYTYLHNALMYRKHEIAKLLIEAGADVNKRSYDWSPLERAIKRLPEAVPHLISAGADINSQDNIGKTALMMAVEDKKIDCVKQLLEAGADPKIKTNGGETAISFGERIHCGSEIMDLLNNHKSEGLVEKNKKLIKALDDGKLDEAKKLLSEGADINVISSNYPNWNPIHSAARGGNSETVKFMIENGVDVNILAALVDGTPDANWTPLHFAAKNGYKEIVQALIGAGADVNAVEGKNNKTALELARDKGYSDVVKIFEEHCGLSIEEKNMNLVVALDCDKLDDAKKLLDDGADINALFIKDGISYSAGWSPLHIAARGGNSETVKFMIDNGVDVNMIAANVNGHSDANWTPLHFAARNNNRKCVQMLLEAGADASLGNGDGRTPRTLASRNGYGGIVKIFEEHRGKDLEEKNKKLVEALRFNNLDDAKKLFDDGADINAVFQYSGHGYSSGWSPLHIAARDGRDKTVKFMIENGVDVNPIAEHVDDPKANWTPLHFAAWNGHNKIAQMLLDAGADTTPVEGIYKKTAIGIAEKRCNSAIVTMLKEYEAKEKSAEVDNLSLFSAIDHRDIGEVKKLLAAGVDPNKRNQLDWSPLEKAIKYLPEAVPHLISAGADVNSVDKAGGTALWLAIDNKNQEGVIKQLVEAGAEISDSLVVKVKDYGLTEVVRLFEEYLSGKEKAMTQEELDKKLLELFSGIVPFDEDEARRLIEAGADVNVKDSKGWNPIHFASRDGDKNCLLPLLLKHGAEANVEGTDWTPICLAAYNGHKEAVGQLLDAGADPNIMGFNRKTALEVGCETMREFIRNWKPKGLTHKLFATITAAAHKGFVGGAISCSSNFLINQVDKLMGNPEILQLGVSRPAIKALLGISFIGISRQYPELPHAEVVKQASVLLLEAGAEEGVDEVCELVEPILIDFMSDITALEPADEHELLEAKAEGTS